MAWSENTFDAASERMDTSRDFVVKAVMSSRESYAAQRDALQKRIGLAITPLTGHADYAELAAKHLDIANRRAKIDRDAQSARTELARGMVAFQNSAVEDAAQAIIDGREGEAFQGFEELRARAARLQEESKAYQEALRIVKGQMDAIAAERSIDAAEAAAPHHRKVVAEIADACAMLVRALSEESMIRDLVTAAGYDARLPIFNFDAPPAVLERHAREYVG